jgi:hypothetical protein
LLQNPVILRNAARISLPLVSSEKHTAQHLEKLRKQSCLNYKSAALSGEAAGPKVGKAERTRTKSLLFGTRGAANFITAD